VNLEEFSSEESVSGLVSFEMSSYFVNDTLTLSLWFSFIWIQIENGESLVTRIP